MTKKLQLPKKYLSYSAISLWCSNPDEYIRRYFEGKKGVETRYTLFGNEIHKLVEDGKLEIQEHPKEKYMSEQRIYVHIKDNQMGWRIPILGYLDLFNPKTKAFSDIKTGVARPDGTPRWTQLEVEKLDQLPFYSLLIEEKYGKVQKTCKLIWLPTENEKRGIGNSSKLRITGEQYIFKRRIEPWERERMQDLIVTSAREISDAYEKYTKKN